MPGIGAAGMFMSWWAKKRRDEYYDKLEKERKEKEEQEKEGKHVEINNE